MYFVLDVNIVVLDDFDRRKITPSLGLLSTTARTFIQEGTTTEFATHIYGTTLGDKYAHIVSTGSKIFYDHMRPSKDKIADPIITIPSLDSLIFSPEENVVLPSKVVREKPSDKSILLKQPSEPTSEKPVTHPHKEIFGKNSKSLKADIPSISEKVPITLNHPKPGTEISIRKEVSIRPAKVKSRNQLPTFTVKPDSAEYETTGDRIQNSEYEIDNAFEPDDSEKRPHFIARTQPLTTTTYFGFADFVTTAGDTVIVFTPQTRKSAFEGSVTSIIGEPTFFRNTITPSVVKVSTPASSAETIFITASDSRSTSAKETTTTASTQSAIVKNEVTSEQPHTESPPPPPQPETTTELTEVTTEETTIEELVENEFTTTVDAVVDSNEQSPLSQLDSTVDDNEQSSPPQLEDNRISEISHSNNGTPTTLNKPTDPNSVYRSSTLSATTVTSDSRSTESKPSEIDSTVEVATQSVEITDDDANRDTDHGDESTKKQNNTDSTEKATEANETTTSVETDDISTDKEVESEKNTTTTELTPPRTEEEVELIFKTLYTTYTYLTTYFEKSSTTVRSREEVVTNVITSTLDSAFLQQATDPAVAGLFSNHREAKYLSPVIGNGRSTTTYPTPDEQNENEIFTSKFVERFNELGKPTPVLKFHSGLTESGMKSATFSSPAVLRNVDRSSTRGANDNAKSSSRLDLHLDTDVSKIFAHESALLERLPGHSYKTTIKRHKTATTSTDATNRDLPVAKNSIVTEEMTHNAVAVSAPLIGAPMDGGLELAAKKQRPNNESEEDQLSEESNTEETRPPNQPPLISLQTSYTTYTYFTTIYKGSSSDIVSRLETITNVNTELIKPSSTQPVSIEHATAPVTYYTTYTYWTTFYKDGSTMIKSRQETISNVVSPTPSLQTIQTTEPASVIGTTNSTGATETASSTILTTPVTFYTTFTYFTTSYVGNSSVVNSHLETTSHVVEASEMKESEHPIFQPSLASTEAEAETASDSVNRSAEHPILPSVNTKPTGIISVEEGKIIDAFGISTTFYTTSIVGTYIQQLYAQVIESTSSVLVNTEKRTNLVSPATIVLNDKIYQTGILRTHEGSIVKDGATTFYATKILGSVIDGRYSSVTETSFSVRMPQITPSKTVDIQPTSSVRLSASDTATVTASSILLSASPSSAVIESSMNEHSNEDSDTTDEEGEGEEEEKNEKSSSGKYENNRRKSFTPVIRPFSSRSRPTFQPKRKTGEPSSAATITRGITPTIVAIPAKKTSESHHSFGSANRNRFVGGGKKVSPSLSSSFTSHGVFQHQSASAVNARRYSRTKSNVPYNNAISSSHFTRHTTEKLNPTHSSSYSNYRRGGYRSSSSSVKLPHQGNQPFPGSRFRIRPTTSGRSSSSLSTSPNIQEGNRDGDEDENEDIKDRGEERQLESRERRPQQTYEEEQDESSITEQTLSSSDDQVVETLAPITTESSHRINPLLRFRKPLSPRTTTIASTTSRPTTQRKSVGARRNDARPSTVRTVTKPSSYSKSGLPPPPPHSANSRIRLKSTNSLFAANVKHAAKASTTEASNEDDDNVEGLPQHTPEEQTVGDADDDTESLAEGEQQLPLETNGSAVVDKATGGEGRRIFNPVSIKPFPRRGGRTRRQAEFGYKYEGVKAAQKSRYRRPNIQNSFPDYLYYDDVEYTTEEISPRSIGNRNYAKSRNTQSFSPPTYQQQFYQQYSTEEQPAVKVRPSSVYSGRTPFTLREKSSSTTPLSPRSGNHYRRTTTTTPTSFLHRRNENNFAAPKRPFRQRTYTTTTTTESLPLSYRNGRKPSPTRRTSSRSRYKDNDFNSNAFSQASNFDGSITVTHKIPEEVTIPVVSGTVTEYKNVVTAKPSVQVLAPHQYSTVTGKNGLTTLQLVAENSETMLNGVVEVTRYVIQEFPTSSVTFTPTTIRGRKTSFSHVIPSTIYEVKPEVSTIPPQLNANAPLANLLLSQLLLGNLGIQQTLNPLLGLNGAAAAAIAGTPITEYKTKTTSYVTTITHSTSTIIPVTFRGKEIKTTVVDSSTQVITATEYLTDTVVITPTNTVPPAVNNQFNTLLLPALLQAQLLNQPTAAQVAVSATPEDVAENLQFVQDLAPSSKSSRKGENLESNGKSNDEYAGSRKKSKTKPFDSPIEPAETTSVVTLYLSGRRPGEFSTVLSTVMLDEEKSATLQKRNAFDWKTESASALPKSTIIPHLHPSSSISLVLDENDLEENLIKSGINELSAPSIGVNYETQTLESVVGDVNDYLSAKKVRATTAAIGDEEAASATNGLETSSNHFLLKTSAESAPFQRNSEAAFRSKGVRRKRDAARHLKSNEKDDNGRALHFAKTVPSSPFGSKIINAPKKGFSKNVAFGSHSTSPNENIDFLNRTIFRLTNRSLPGKIRASRTLFYVLM